MLVPLYGFLEGDTIGLLVLAHAGDLIRDVAADLQQAAAVRVEPFDSYRVYAGEHLLDLDQTVAQSGLSALDRIDVRQGRK